MWPANKQSLKESKSSRTRDDTGRACKALQRFGSGLLRGPKFYAGEIEEVVIPRVPTGMAGCGRRVVWCDLAPALSPDHFAGLRRLAGHFKQKR